MGLYANVEDVALEWNREVPTESMSHVSWLIDKAEGYVRAAVPTLVARITAGSITEADVRHVVASMVVRVLNNPRGLSGETGGDYSYQFEQGSGSGRMRLTKEERLLIGGRARPASVPVIDDALQRPTRPPFWWDGVDTTWQPL